MEETRNKSNKKKKSYKEKKTELHDVKSELWGKSLSLYITNGLWHISERYWKCNKKKKYVKWDLILARNFFKYYLLLCTGMYINTSLFGCACELGVERLIF